LILSSEGIAKSKFHVHGGGEKDTIDKIILHSDVDGDGLGHCNEWVSLIATTQPTTQNNLKQFRWGGIIIG
jgi:hypothetical protein